MSRRIEEIVEVIQEVRDNFRTVTGGRSIRGLRIQAGASVARRRGIERTTVSDKFRRRLRPEIDGTADFDRLLEDWLVRDSDELRKILLRRTSDPGDVELINNVFHDATEPDILTAQEFEYDPYDVSFREGSVQLCLHLRRGRNRSLVIRAKEIWNREQNGEVHCSICSFSFEQTYGKIGENFIEAHHTQPVSSLAPDTPVSLTDLVPICSNCHSIVHRRRPPVEVEELRTILSEQRK